MQSKLYPCLTFKNTKETLHYYETVFGATKISRLAPSPEHERYFGLPEGLDVSSLTIHDGFLVLGVKVQCLNNFYGNLLFGKQITLQIDIRFKKSL